MLTKDIPHPPLSNHFAFSTTDISAAINNVSSHIWRHSLRISDEKSFNAFLYTSSLSNITISYLGYNTELRVLPEANDDFILVQLPLSGSTILCFPDERQVVTTFATASVISSSRPPIMFATADCKTLEIRIRRTFIEQELSRILLRPLGLPLEFAPSMSTQGDIESAAWWRLIWFVVAELDQNSLMLRDKDTVEYFEKTIVHSLLKAQSNNYDFLLEEKELQVTPTYVRHAEDYMRENISEKITLDDLVALTSVSARSLQQGFKRYKNSSPMRYLRGLRLQKARQLLLRGDSTNVTDVATSCGFYKLDRFSEQYKQSYKELPSTTLKSARKNHFYLSRSDNRIKQRAA